MYVTILIIAAFLAYLIVEVVIPEILWHRNPANRDANDKIAKQHEEYERREEARRKK